MTLGYDQPLYLLAFDHRRPHLAKLFGVGDHPTAVEATRIVDAKSVIFDGFTLALAEGAPADSAGILVDEQFGADVARTTLAHGWICAVPVERSGVSSFEFEYGTDFAAHIENVDPTFAKVLVRYNVDGTKADNARSIERLRTLSDWLHEHDRKLLCELIVPAEPAQLQSVDGDPRRYETELRPALMQRAMADFQTAGIEADVWKIEGIDRGEDCEMVTRQARAGGRDDVGCVVLGSGADPEQVEHWLRTAAAVSGYVGFAIGRTLWWDEVTAYLEGALSRADAASRISTNYRHAIDVYRGP